jgi:hypothetical protein
MAYKRKKSHGGLKFLGVIVALVITIVVTVKATGTEVGQRVLGNREDLRLEHTALTPRFGFASASVRVSVGEMYNNDGSTVDITATRDVSIDRQSSTAKSDIKVERTSAEVSPGVNAVPYDAINSSYTVILTKDHRYESPEAAGGPWTLSPSDPYYYETEIDKHYIPMIDDIMGFELRGLPSTPADSPAKSGLASLIRKRATGATPPSAVTTSYTYQFDLATYRRAVPILASRTGLGGPPETPVTLTIGFDDVGLLRFADVSIATSVASTLAQQIGPKHMAIYHYTFSVTEISGEPISIDMPTNVIDAP